MKVAIGISGASGTIYAKRLIEYLSEKHQLFVVASEDAYKIAKFELNLDLRALLNTLNVKIYDNSDFFSPLASGSFLLDRVIILPCSMKTLASVANGFADSIISRMCDVAIKERRVLTLSPREMPFSAIHLENMLKLAKIGVNIAPPICAFYNKPYSINDLVDFVVGKILDISQIENDIYKRWK